ncbi:MAG: hypothetical protein U5N26_01820 [Candidatus Marinimicrobia bacterium]|nr:hypothetical protein [Candidatus Neomarinimicrobiota bacterium]
MGIKQYLFMYDKFRRDLRTPRERYPLARDLRSGTLGEYYFVFSENRVRSGADQPLISKFDRNGIPVNKTYVDVTDKEYVYFPISIGQMGLAVFHTYLRTKKRRTGSVFYVLQSGLRMKSTIWTREAPASYG